MQDKASAVNRIVAFNDPSVMVDKDPVRDLDLRKMPTPSSIPIQTLGLMNWALGCLATTFTDPTQLPPAVLQILASDLMGTTS